jgi:putative cardiolipin synthase
MQPVLIVLVALAGIVLASSLALLSYRRFFERARGEPSFALPCSEDATPLDGLVAPLIAEHPNQSGLILLPGNLDAFAARVLTARQAGRSLDLQYYLWQRDLTGRLLTWEVLRAADRGVRVRLLVDDINAHRYDRAYLALETHPNISIRLFNPSRTRDGFVRRGIELLLRAFRINRRMHNKAWIADGRIAVIGGRNIGDAYFDAAESANFRDLDLLTLGSAVRQAETVFDGYWNSKAVVPIRALGRLRRRSLPRIRRRLVALAGDAAARPYLDRVAKQANVREMLSEKGQMHWTADARLLADPPEKSKGTGRENWLINHITPLLNSARADLEIISPYFIPGNAGTGELVEMVSRGVKVSVLTNSLAATDVTAVHGAYARCRRPLIEGGVGLFELKPYDERRRNSLFGSRSASLHTKAFTIDDRLGFVGSMNFDPRSASLNTEMGVVFEHDGLVRQIRDIFADETSPQKSYRVRIESGEIVWQDGSSDGIRTWRDEPGAGIGRRLMATLISFLPIESQL